MAALSPVTPGLAQPRGAGGPPHCDGPADRAHERAGSDRRRAPEIHGAVGDPRPAAPARARPTAPGEEGSGDTGRRSGTPVRSPTGHPRPLASGRCPTPARVEPQGREADLGHRGERPAWWRGRARPTVLARAGVGAIHNQPHAPAPAPPALSPKDTRYSAQSRASNHSSLEISASFLELIILSI